MFHFADSFSNLLTYMYLKLHLAQLLGACSVLPMGWASTRLLCALSLPVSDPSSLDELCASQGLKARDEGRGGSGGSGPGGYWGWGRLFLCNGQVVKT